MASTPSSPLQRLQSQLATQVSSGAISSDDQSALSSALSDIDSAMRSGGPKAPGGMKAKIDSLIQGEVSSGKLTASQAAELKDVFAKTFEGAGGAHGPGGAGGPGGGHGPRGAGGGGDKDGASESSSSTSADPADANGDGVVTAAEQAAYDSAHPEAAQSSGGTSDASATGAGASDTSKLMSDFLKLLQDATGNAQAYGASGGLTSASAALVLNFQA